MRQAPHFDYFDRAGSYRCSQRAAFEVIYYSVDSIEQYLVMLRDDCSPYLCLHDKEADLRATADYQGIVHGKSAGLLKAYSAIDEP